MESDKMDMIVMPRSIYDLLVSKIDNLCELVSSQIRREYESEYVDLDGARKILQYGNKKIETFRKNGLPYYQWEPNGKIFYRRKDLIEFVEKCRRIDGPTVPIELWPVVSEKDESGEGIFTGDAQGGDE